MAGTVVFLSPDGAVSHRGWARVLDLCTWQLPLTVITYLALGVVLPWHMRWPDTASEMLLLAPAFLPVIALESTFLAVTGTTPGKALCHLRVHNRENPALMPQPREALIRSAVVQTAAWAGVPFAMAMNALHLPFGLEIGNTPFIPLILVTLPASRSGWVALQDLASGLAVSREQRVARPRTAPPARDPFAPRSR